MDLNGAVPSRRPLTTNPLLSENSPRMPTINPTHKKPLMVTSETRSDERLDLGYTWPATHPVTDEIPNRAHLIQYISSLIERDWQRLFTVAIIQINNYAEIVTTFGFTTVNQLIDHILTSLEFTDTPRRPIFQLLPYLFGIVFFENETRPDALHQILNVLGQPQEIDGVPIYVDASLGLALYPSHGAQAIDLIRKAFVATEIARETRMQTAIYDSTADLKSQESLALIGAVPQAIVENQFELYYQPYIDLNNDGTVGVEALLRWHHPDKGLLYPQQFIPLTEETAHIGPMTRWVLEAAVHQASRWAAAGLSTPVAVNVPGRLVQDPTLVNVLKKLLTDTGIHPGQLVLEITENTVLVNPEQAIRHLKLIKDLGIRLAFDDFGTGYSSLAYLQLLPLDSVKIDRTFSQSLSVKTGSRDIVQAIIFLARSFGLKVVAEGVEDQVTLDILRGMGCDCAQGNFISPPVNGFNALMWLRRQHQML